MLTEDKIKIYKSFEGDGDQFLRSGSKRQLRKMEDGDWALIESLLQDILLVSRGLASTQFENRLKIQLVISCDNEKTIVSLNKLVPLLESKRK